MRKFTLSLLFGIAVIAISLVACDQRPATTDEKMQAAQDKIIDQANSQLGMPGIIHYTEKRTLKNIYELCDQEHLICYAYLFNEFSGKFVFLGKCEGYGVPYATQYSNPNRICNSNEEHSQGNLTITQAEPNGLYKPATADGTWILLLDSKGVPHPLYCEPHVLVSPFELPSNLVQKN